jgi:hypothetical protein
MLALEAYVKKQTTTKLFQFRSPEKSNIYLHIKALHIKAYLKDVDQRLPS